MFLSTSNVPDPDPQLNTYMLLHSLPQPLHRTETAVLSTVEEGGRPREVRQLAEVTQLGSNRPRLDSRLCLPLEAMPLTTKHAG